MKYVSWIILFSCFTALRAETVDFNRDVRPILSDKCYFCHGPDQELRKGELRLDTAEGAAKVLRGEKGGESELVRRITASDPEIKMPPPDSNLGKSLSAREVEILQAWLKAGAKYAKHWSFESPKQQPLPENKHADWQSPIDRWIHARLTSEKLTPSPQADKITLLRRGSLDITGLLPTPAEVDAFIQDTSPQAYEHAVDRLLASPRFGERMALLWMDLARYGDSSVYHADGPRDMWAWRDGVIRAFNTNQPFNQFTIEQLAGDLLPNATLEQKIASGFNRNHATTDEGGVIPEEFRVDYVVDRVKTVSSTWLAMSLECGQCHDHKYDPISQKEYYQFYAYFNNTKDGGMQTRNGNAAPLIEVPDPEADRKRAIATEAQTAVQQKITEHVASANVKIAFDAWLVKQKPAAELQPLDCDPAFYLPCDENDKQTFVSSLEGRVALFTEGKPAEAKRPGGDGFKLAGNAAPEFNQDYDLEWNQPFTFAAWVKIPKGGGGPILARMNNEQDYQGFDIGCEGLKPGLHLVHKWSSNGLKVYTKHDIKPDEWQHITITYDGSGKAAGIKIYVNGESVEPQVHNDSLSGTILNTTPLRLGSRSGGTKYNGELDDIALYRVAFTPEQVKRAATSLQDSLIALSPEMRTASQLELLKTIYLRAQDKQYANLQKELSQKFADVLKNKRGVASVMIMEDLPANQMRVTYVLNRGQYDKPVKEKQVQPGVPALFPALAADAPTNRLGLAQWLVRADHPLTSRVAVNRLWQMMFGEGLVRTSEDFGLQGEMPTHPELLDWIAMDFVQSGWDVKRLLKQIMLSSTYRQDSRATPQLLERDPENRLLARGPRFRLQGEFIRDNALFVSGLLVEHVGGPSVKPYQPVGIWEEVALDTNLSKFVQDHEQKLYRRSMYTYWKRSSPHPSLMIFDAPTREKCTGKRPRTNTPLQALVTLNDPQFVEAARKLAERSLQSNQNSFEARLRFAFRECLSREPTSKETILFRKLFDSQFTKYQADPKQAEALLKIGESPRTDSIPLPELAAWTVLANTLLNLDEFLVKN